MHQHPSQTDVDLTGGASGFLLLLLSMWMMDVPDTEDISRR